MSERRASDVFVECLEAEGVKYVFGIPGEETLDLNESLANSSVSFVPVRHEQGGAYMADMYGRLTGRAGVCLGTLGPGATNLVTAVADAFLDRAPLVALTGQADLERMHKESHQYIDLVELMRPITKWNARVTQPRRSSPRSSARRSRSPSPRSRARRTSSCPRTSWPQQLDAEPLPRRRPVKPEPGARELLQAPPTSSATRSTRSRWPATASCAPAPRPRCASSRRATGIAVAETFMGKGVLDYEDPSALGTVGLQSRDYAMAGFEDADVVHRHRLRPRRARAQALEPQARQEDRRHRLRRRPRSTSTSRPRSSSSATSTTCSRAWPRSAATSRTPAARARLREVVLGRFERGEGRRRTSRCSRRARCGRSARRWAARTSSSPTSACTSCGSGGCSPPTSRTRC